MAGVKSPSSEFGAASDAAIAASSREKANWRFADLVASVAFALLASQAVALFASDTAPSLTGSEVSGLSFIVFAACYRGSLATWWSFFAPLSLLFLFAPIARWEAVGALELAGILRTALVPGLSFVAGSAISVSRGTKSGAFAATYQIRSLYQRQILALKDLKSLETEMKDLLQTLNARNASLETLAVPWTIANEAHSTEQLTDQLATTVEPSDAMGHLEMCRVIASEIENFKAMGRKGVKFGFSAPMDIPFPLAVRANRETFQRLVRAILAQGIAALGNGGQGVVRVTLRPGLRSVTLSFEDNGRGLHEDMIHSLEAKDLAPKVEGSMKLADIRRGVYAAGWKMEVQTRLGVGSRMTLELARVDAFAYGARTQAGLRDPKPSVDHQDSRHA